MGTEQHSIEFYSQFLSKGDLCFDVGANTGSRTDLFLKLGAKVLCIEPQTSCLNHLYHSFASNENVRIVPKALGDREGYAQLSICENAPTISTLSNKWKVTGRFSTSYNWDKKQQVSMTTLDALIKEYGIPKFCKIDVEGFEYFVLKGLSTPIPYLSFEFTKEFFADAILSMDYLLTIGHPEFNFSLGETLHFISSQWLGKEDLCNRLEFLFQDDHLLWGDIYVKFS